MGGLLYKELSYRIQGIAMDVRKNYGPGHKETLYQNAFEECLRLERIPYQREREIAIWSPKTGKKIGVYRPDFIIDDKIIIELKALVQAPKLMIDQLYSYLRNSTYELGYFINFGSEKLYIRRIIYTNEYKKFKR